MYGNGINWGWMNGMMGGYGMGIWGILTMLVFWVAFILLIVWLVKTIVASSSSGASNAKSILDQRYARGEITRKEYEQMKKDIGS